MKFFEMPKVVVNRHRKALALTVKTELAALRRQYSIAGRKDFCKYLDCLIGGKRSPSIVVRPIVELAKVVHAVEDVKAEHPDSDWNELELRLGQIFDYEARFRDALTWNSGKYIELMIERGLLYCPYCNAHPLEANPIKPKDDRYNKGPLDHFYDKATYPYLALSIYNLIPVCDRCNNKKGRKRASLETHSHPFADDYDALMCFHANKTDLPKLLDGQAKTCRVELRPTDRQRAEQAEQLSIDVGLHGRYSGRVTQEVAASTLVKAQRHPKSALTTLRELAQVSNMTFQEAAAEWFGVRFDGADINRQQYGKLKHDMLPDELRAIR